MQTHTIARLLLATSLVIEGGSALHRFRRRRLAFEAAVRRASELGRPLIVVGDPDAGAHTRLLRAYDCGDLCIDLRGCPKCPVVKIADITNGPIEGIADDSAVVFVSCVLEYVTDPAAALQELARIAGSRANLFLVLVEPWTLTATLYPGARWSGFANDRIIAMQPVTPALKAATLGGLVALSVLAARGRRA
ncbi:MAG: hypothetical protein JNL82_36475 [Myxococcales bacterium]|nr:hypothetical protein [Myxococcales bacterium]